MNAEEKSRRRASMALVALCSLLYFTSYLTRKSFSAVKLGIPGDILTSIQMGNIGSALFFAYGAGQIVSGILTDKRKPEHLIYCGLILTMLCNVLFPILRIPVVQTVLWALNGFAQALFWPPILKLINTRCERSLYESACVTVSVCSHIATLVIYFLASRIIAAGSWQQMFYIAAGFAFIIFIALVLLFPRVGIRDEESPADTAPAKKENAVAPQQSFMRFFIFSGFILVCLSMVMGGFLRDGIDEWLPKFLTDVFGIGGDIATLSAVVLPIFGIVMTKLSQLLYSTLFRRNELAAAVFFYLLAAGASLLLYFLYDIAALPSLILFMLISGCMYGANLCLTCFTPTRYARTGRMSTAAGIVNAAVYVGSTIATTLLPVLFSSIGWGKTMLAFALVAVLGALFCVILIRPYGKGNSISEP